MKDLYYSTTIGDICYKEIGEGPVTVLLHGWGKSKETFDSLASLIKGKVIAIDLPGFGLSDEPEKPLKIIDYALVLKQILTGLGFNDIMLIGHSFGGRIAIKFTAMYPNFVKHLFLVNSAGIKKHNLKYYCIIGKYKIKKAYLKLTSKQKYQDLIKNSGSSDYQAASYIMRGTLKKVVAEDLKKDLRKINVKTSIIAGFYDSTVKYSDQLLMHKLIRNSKLYPFFKSGHFAYIDEESKLLKIIEKESGETNGDMSIYN